MLQSLLKPLRRLIKDHLVNLHHLYLTDDLVIKYKYFVGQVSSILTGSVTSSRPETSEIVDLATLLNHVV